LDLLGWFAGALVTLSLLPQIIRVFRLRSAREISLLFNTMLLSGILLWLGYGIA
jgi:MtN3 and saliva related transmembrane protein